jgi:hypothetical protein
MRTDAGGWEVVGGISGTDAGRRVPTTAGSVCACNPLNTRDFMQKQNIQPDFCNVQICSYSSFKSQNVEMKPE